MLEGVEGVFAAHIRTGWELLIGSLGGLQRCNSSWEKEMMSVSTSGIFPH